MQMMMLAAVMWTGNMLSRLGERVRMDRLIKARNESRCRANVLVIPVESLCDI